VSRFVLQPHESSSETPASGSCSSGGCDFNLTRVRLKLTRPKGRGFLQGLQPHESSSETYYPIPSERVLTDFNLTRVRLKHRVASRRRDSTAHFNLTRVRLKLPLTVGRSAPEGLQPHESSSETRPASSPSLLGLDFNLTRVRLKPTVDAHDLVNRDTSTSREFV